MTVRRRSGGGGGYDPPPPRWVSVLIWLGIAAAAVGVALSINHGATIP